MSVDQFLSIITREHLLGREELRLVTCSVQGEMLSVIRQVDNNWYEGRRGDAGPSGIFPISYVETIVEPQSLMTTPMSSLATSPLPGSRSPFIILLTN